MLASRCEGFSIKGIDSQYFFRSIEDTSDFKTDRKPMVHRRHPCRLITGEVDDILTLWMDFPILSSRGPGANKQVLSPELPFTCLAFAGSGSVTAWAYAGPA